MGLNADAAPTVSLLQHIGIAVAESIGRAELQEEAAGLLGKDLVDNPAVLAAIGEAARHVPELPDGHIEKHGCALHGADPHRIGGFSKSGPTIKSLA
jgi:hypothetical protein